MHFDTLGFLTGEFGTAHNVLSLFSRYGLEGPATSVVEKWFQRSSVPSTWLPVIISLLELEHGRAPISKYLRGG